MILAPPPMIQALADLTHPVYDAPPNRNGYHDPDGIVWWETPFGKWHGSWAVKHLHACITDPTLTLTARRQAGAVLAWRDVHERSWWMRLLWRWPE